ncbi:hypothetical protein WDV06_13230 [Streptomyces racemochromogenes]|uniref:Uncharacterized protein n=1 Tax=Streptomyces racemochromogenes TaxID=67353 RepID=A0ABW7PCD7_9ACTN
MRWKVRRVGKGPTINHRAVRRAAGNIAEKAKRRARPFDDIFHPRSVRGPRPVHRTVARAFTGAVIALASAFTVAFEIGAEIPYFMEPRAGVLGLPIGMGLFCLCTAAVAVCAAQRGGAVKQTPGRAVNAVAMVPDVVYDVLHMVTTRRHAGQRSEGSLHARKV